mgnify:CR=1 FL=1
MIFRSLKCDSQPKNYKNLEKIKQIHEKQMEDLQSEYRKLKTKLDNKITDLKEHNDQLEFNLKDTSNQLDKLKMKYEHKVQEEYRTREYELKYNDLESEKNRIINSLEEELGK